MHLQRLRIRGFGCLQGQWRFDASFNVIEGPSASGKTTLARAVVALLYGTRDGGEIESLLDNDEDRYRPVRGEAFALDGEIVLGDESVLEIRRDLHRDTCSVFDAATGEDRSAEYADAPGCRIGQTLLGLDRSGFLALCCPNQLDLPGLSDLQSVAPLLGFAPQQEEASEPDESADPEAPATEAPAPVRRLRDQIDQEIATITAIDAQRTASRNAGYMLAGGSIVMMIPALVIDMRSMPQEIVPLFWLIPFGICTLALILILRSRLMRKEQRMKSVMHRVKLETELAKAEQGLSPAAKPMATAPAVVSEYSGDLDALNRTLGEASAAIFPGKTFRIDDTWQVTTQVGDQAATHPSRGELDVVAAITRLTLLDLPLWNERPPLLLDEALASLDGNALAATLMVLERSKGQVLVFTSQSGQPEGGPRPSDNHIRLTNP